MASSVLRLTLTLLHELEIHLSYQVDRWPLMTLDMIARINQKYREDGMDGFPVYATKMSQPWTFRRSIQLISNMDVLLLSGATRRRMYIYAIDTTNPILNHVPNFLTSQSKKQTSIEPNLPRSQLPQPFLHVGRQDAKKIKKSN